MNKKTLAFATAALALASASAVMAQGTMSSGSTMGKSTMSGKSAMAGKPMMHAKMVAYCAKCKMYYSAADAKKMHMMDSMGHKMTMMSMSKVPAGATMGHMSMKTMKPMSGSKM